MSSKILETQTNTIEILNRDKLGVIEIAGKSYETDYVVAKFIMELIDEIETLSDQLTIFRGYGGNA
jgi:hypothetical protein